MVLEKKGLEMGLRPKDIADVMEDRERPNNRKTPKIRAMQKKYRLSQKEIAEWLGVSDRTISYWAEHQANLEPLPQLAHNSLLFLRMRCDSIAESNKK